MNIFNNTPLRRMVAWAASSAVRKFNLKQKRRQAFGTAVSSFKELTESLNKLSASMKAFDDLAPAFAEG
jgi:hypothetical protein